MMKALALLVIIALAGCVDRPVAALPEAWIGGEELLAHSTSRSHSGAFEVRVFPEGNLAIPASCNAYRGGSGYAGDVCRIMTPGSSGWYPIDEPAWGLAGSWEGRFKDTADDPDPNYPRRLVAFNADGVVVAYWDGALHPDASHSTE